MSKIYTLDNKFKVILDHIPYRNAVTVGIWLPIGSRFETTTENGYAHFTEHLLFKGTHKRSYLDISRQIDKLGGYINASTSREVTNYYITIRDKYLEQALDILSDIFYNSTFLEKEFTTEQRVILEEIKMGEDTPDELLFDLFYSYTFPKQPLGMPIAGTLSNIKKSTVNHLYEFYTNKYSPKGAVLSIAGSIYQNASQEKKIKNLIKKYFDIHNSQLKGSLDLNHIKDTAKLRTKGTKHYYKDLEQTHLIVALPGSLEDKEYNPSMDIFTHMLGGSMSSILFRKLREEKGLCYSIGAFNSKYYKEGVWGVYCGTSNKYFLQAIELLIQEINNAINNHYVSEIEDSKTGLMGMLSLTLESTFKRAYFNAMSILYKKKNITFQDKLEKIRNMKSDNIMNDIKNMWYKKECIITSIGKQKEDTTVNSLKNIQKKISII